MNVNAGQAETGSGGRFYPDYLFEVLLVIFIVIETVIGMAFLFPPSVGRPLDLAGQYDPRPEWYFLWLYELIRYFPGPSAVLGAVILPLGMFIGLGLIPFLDRHRDSARRGPAWGLLAGVVGGWVLLTVLSFWRS